LNFDFFQRRPAPLFVARSLWTVARGLTIAGVAPFVALSGAIPDAYNPVVL
jgi:hypothetical protein